MAVNHVLDLCAGIGGFSLAGKLIGDWRTVCYVEIDPYCQKVIRARIKDGYLDDAPIYSNLRTFDGRPWRGCVDIITAGFPCTPFSFAARGRHTEKSLWPEIARVIKEARPPTVFLENVPGARNYLRGVHDDLRTMGFHVYPPAVIAAACVGAPHKRDRVWLLADRNCHSKPGIVVNDETSGGKTATRSVWWETFDSSLLDMVDGVPGELDGTRAAGRAIVPEVARRAWKVMRQDEPA